MKSYNALLIEMIIDFIGKDFGKINNELIQWIGKKNNDSYLLGHVLPLKQ